MRSHPEQTTSPPLMVHAVRARGPGAGGIGGDSGRAQDTADTHSPEVLAASLDGAVRSRAPWVGYRASLFCRSADRSGTERSSWDQSSPAFFQCTLLAARRGGTASAAVGFRWDSAATRSPELDAQRSAPRGQDLPRALPAADPTLHAYTQCPRSVSAPLRPLALSVNGARSSPSPSSEEGARESVRCPGGSGRGSKSRSA